ncbi:hypothetical protein GS489_01115 [Rhodococcus hoagii]|nr:hypothetical protein [Prescottella equi]
MVKKRDQLNAVFTAVIFGAVGAALIQVPVLFAAAGVAMTYFWTWMIGGSVDQIHGFEWGSLGPHLAIFGATLAVFLAAGYGAHRTTTPFAEG